MQLTMHRRENKMLHTIKTEEDKERAARRVFLYSIPAYKSSAPGMAESATEMIPRTRWQLSQRHTKPVLRLRLRAPGPKRLMLRGPRAVPRINCRYSIPGSESKMYVHHGKRYGYPEGIKPWLPDKKWMLDPRVGVFRKFASRVKLADDTYYYIPEEAMTDGSEPEDSE